MAKKKSRFGKKDSIFSSTDTVEMDAGGAKAAVSVKGRPRSHAEEWTKVTVVLFNRQITFLDEQSLKIRRETGNAVSRTEIIRALVDFLKDSKIDLADIETEADIKAKLLSAL